MANIIIIFKGAEFSGTEKHELIAYANQNKIYVSVQMEKEEPSFICLDKATAVRLVRELKKQIGYLESEVDNG
jgi:hypothetical protein